MADAEDETGALAFKRWHCAYLFVEQKRRERQDADGITLALLFSILLREFL